MRQRVALRWHGRRPRCPGRERHSSRRRQERSTRLFRLTSLIGRRPCNRAHQIGLQRALIALPAMMCTNCRIRRPASVRHLTRRRGMQKNQPKGLHRRYSHHRASGSEARRLGRNERVMARWPPSGSCSREVFGSPRSRAALYRRRTAFRAARSHLGTWGLNLDANRWRLRVSQPGVGARTSRDQHGRVPDANNTDAITTTGPPTCIPNRL